MNKGTITNKTTGDVLHGSRYEEFHGKEWFLFKIDGDDLRRRSFNVDDWTYDETKPTAQELVESFEIGTKFKVRTKDGEYLHEPGVDKNKGYWLKVSPTHMLFTSDEGSADHLSEFYIIWPNETIEEV